MPPVDFAGIESATRDLSSAQQARVFFPEDARANFTPVQIFVNGRWSAENSQSLSELAKGQRVRLLGRYVGPPTINSRELAYLLTAPPDTCGGGVAIGLDRQLKVARNWVVVEGTIIDGNAGSIGRYHRLLPLRLGGAELVAEGRAAVEYVIRLRT